jgi:FkbM family methyltransferase
VKPAGAVSRFRHALFSGLVRDLYSLQATGADPVRFRLGRRQRVAVRAKDALAVAVDTLGVTRRPTRSDPLSEQLLGLVESLDRLEHVYGLFGDAESRALWVELLRYKTLGPRRVKLSRNSRDYWRAYNSIDARFLRGRDSGEACGHKLNFYEVPGAEGPIRMHTHSLFVLNTFVLGQYSYRSTTATVRAEPGDIVIDGGACWGDTALAFADLVGPTGHVHCFEFVPDNLAVLHENLRLNPGLADRISVHTCALWRLSGDALSFDARGPGSFLLDEVGGTTVETVTIDDFVERAKLERVDFLKLDVEGAEAAALTGAVHTIETCTPKLAVAIYHSDEQFVAVPELVAELDPAYRLFLDHLTVHDEETVLYATA